MRLPEQLLLSDLLRSRVRCDQGLDHGTGVAAWMHPPVHRLLGWISKPSSLGDRRQAWRLDQLRGLGEQELFVKGPPADTDLATVDRLPTLIAANLLDRGGDPIGRLVDAAVELRSGRIVHYLVARSDPRLPGSSRWRLSPERIVDQQPGEVFSGLDGLDDLPLARASVRQEFLRRSRRWRDQVQEESNRWRERVQQAGDRFEERLEGWMEEAPWDPAADEGSRGSAPGRWQQDDGPDAWDDWLDDAPGADRQDPGQRDLHGDRSAKADPNRTRTTRRRVAPDEQDQDPWF